MGGTPVPVGTELGPTDLSQSVPAFPLWHRGRGGRSSQQLIDFGLQMFLLLNKTTNDVKNP